MCVAKKFHHTAQAFMTGKQDEVKSFVNLDVKDTSSPLVKKLMKRDRNIGKAGFSQKEIGGGK